MIGDPLERNWIEIQILSKVNERGHAVTIFEIRDELVPNMHETVVCTIFNLRKEGLLRIFDIGGAKMADITATGKAALFGALTAKRCD